MSIVEVSLLQKMELAGAVLALALTAAPAVAGVTPAAALAKSKEAMGGSAWDGVHSAHSRVRIETGGSRGSTKGSTTS